MARLITAGAELQSAVEYQAAVGAAPAIETSIKRSGNAAWRITPTGGSSGFRFTPVGSTVDVYIRFYLYIVALPTGTAVIGGARAGSNNKISFRLTSGGALQLYNSEDNAQIGSDSSALSTATWYRVELYVNLGTLSATAVEARAYTDTPGASAFWNPSGTIDITAAPATIGLYTEGSNATLDYIIDDLAINDSSGSFENTWCGEEHVIVLFPNGNGDNSQWTGSDGNSTDNYQLVDEVPPDSADYVQSNTSGQIDDYELAATPAAMASDAVINVVHVGCYGAVSDPTGADPDIVLRIKASSGGTVEESAAIDVNSSSYLAPSPNNANGNYRLTLYDLPGASTTPWTKADLDAAQVGIRESVTDTHFARIAAIWVMVGYKPGPTSGAMEGKTMASAPAFASLSGNGALSGQGIGDATNIGALAGAGTLAGQGVGNAANHGDLGGGVALAGQGLADSISHGELNGAGALAGQGIASAADLGSLTGTAEATGRSIGDAVACADLAGIGALFGHDAAGAFDVGTLLGAGALIAVGVGSSYEYGELSTTGEGSMDGRSFGFSPAHAELTGAGALVGHGTSGAFDLGIVLGTATVVGVGAGFAYGYGDLTAFYSGSMEARTIAGAFAFAVLAGAGELTGRGEAQSQAYALIQGLASVTGVGLGSNCSFGALSTLTIDELEGRGVAVSFGFGVLEAQQQQVRGLVIRRLHNQRQPLADWDEPLEGIALRKRNRKTLGF